MRNVNKQSAQRSNRGLAVGLLMITLVGLMLLADLCSFNLVRILMVQRQIDGICEAGALAGTAKLTKLDISRNDLDTKKLSAAQKQACHCAENMILHARLLNSPAGGAISVAELSDLGKEIKPGTCQYFIKLADPKNGYAHVDFGDARGKAISCSIAYGYRPLFLSFLSNTCYAIIGNAIAGLPQVDSVIALDLSCSLDDETVVTFVRREWIHNALGAGSFAMGAVTPNTNGCGIIQYVSLFCPNSPHTISNYLGKNYDNPGSYSGSLVNVLPPQNLEKASMNASNEITRPLYFNAYLRSHYASYDIKQRYQPWEAAKAPYYRAYDFATPPGNCDLSVGFGGNGDNSTDMFGNPALPDQSIPGINAFSDLTWQQDKDGWLGYQPAAPGATRGRVDNDPVPSPDQQTFTDLIVNITDPNTIGSKIDSGASPYKQPLQGPDYFTGFSYTFPADDPDPLLRNQTFNFLNLAVVVEAARGNLENTPSLAKGLKNGQMALIDRPVSVDGTIFDMRTIEPKDGYQRAYQRLAMLFTQPLAGILAALDRGYIQKLHRLSDCRFGLATFSSKGTFKGFGGNHFLTFGTLDDQLINPTDARSFYIYCNSRGDPSSSNATYDSGLPTLGGLNDTPIEDGKGRGFRMPRILIDADNDHYLDILSKNKLKGTEFNNCLNYGTGANGIYNCRVQSVCDTAEALETARTMFHSRSYTSSEIGNSRAVAKKVIILIINGEPTGGFNGNEARDTLKIAGKDNQINNTCEADGIAVCTISLNLSKGKAFNRLKEHQALFLTDAIPESSQKGGIAWRAGHGSKYYACENISELEPALADITRRFSQSQK